MVTKFSWFEIDRNKLVIFFAETFTNSILSEEIINESGICQSCFVRFNEHDEHQTLANQIQEDIVSLMDFKILSLEEEHKVKEEHEDTTDAIEYEPFDGDEIFLAEAEDDTETFEEALEEDFHFEVVVDDTKENLRKHTARTIKTDDSCDFIVLELDNQRVYQCDICQKTCKDKSKLRTHREIHTQERNVICPVSFRGFQCDLCSGYRDFHSRHVEKHLKQ